MTPVPELAGPGAAQIAAIQSRMAPWAARHMYLNFADSTKDPARFWNEPAYNRLRQIKAAVDPDGLIRANHPVPGN